MTASAAIALAARIDRTAFLRRTACQTGTRFAGDGYRRPQLFEKDRPREVVPLRIADFRGGLQVGEFLERLDTLGDHDHAERLAQRFDRPEDALAARSPVNVGDEGAVDLDFVGR